MKKQLFLLSFGLTQLSLATALSAESLGTHCWQQQPYNQAFCFDVDNTNGKYFSLVGENIVPEEGTYPIRGSALLDEKIGMFRLEFTQNLGGTLVYENTATINIENLSGDWRDDAGNEGTFHYLGTGPLSAEQLQTLSTRSKQSKLKPKE